MDYNILKKIMSDHLINLEVNKFENGMNGTLKLAEEYVNTLSECTSERLSSSEINFYYKNKLFGNMSGQIPSTSDKKGVRLCKDKMKTETLLTEHNIITTNSILLGENDYDKGLQVVKNGKEPLVLKPLNMYGGRGITLNVDKENFKFAWDYAKKEYETTTKEFKVLIQPLLSGVETRMLVVENKFNSAMLRVPANIVGDGIHTIEELISKKNETRLLNPHLKRLPIKITEVVKCNLKQIGKDLKTVLKKEEIVFVHNSSNISLGGDSYEISHLVGDSLKKLAENTIKVIPGISTAGVDIMFESFEDDYAKVLEVNPGANLRMHHYPLKGEPKAPVNDLIDQMLKNFKLKN